eukprot:527153_1
MALKSQSDAPPSTAGSQQIHPMYPISKSEITGKTVNKEEPNKKSSVLGKRSLQIMEKHSATLPTSPEFKKPKLTPTPQNWNNLNDQPLTPISPSNSILSASSSSLSSVELDTAAIDNALKGTSDSALHPTSLQSVAMKVTKTVASYIPNTVAQPKSNAMEM